MGDKMILLRVEPHYFYIGQYQSDLDPVVESISKSENSTFQIIFIMQFKFRLFHEIVSLFTDFFCVLLY